MILGFCFIIPSERHLCVRDKGEIDLRLLGFLL
jgi:hypothetical protein